MKNELWNFVNYFKFTKLLFSFSCKYKTRITKAKDGE